MSDFPNRLLMVRLPNGSQNGFVIRPKQPAIPVKESVVTPAWLDRINRGVWNTPFKD